MRLEARSDVHAATQAYPLDGLDRPLWIFHTEIRPIQTTPGSC